MSDELKEIREALDSVDRRVVDALAERSRLVQRVADLKVEGTDFVRDIGREEALLGRLVSIGNEAGVDAGLLTRIFHEILEHSVRLQQQRIGARRASETRTEELWVGYQGVEGAYSQLAASRHFSTHEAAVQLRGYQSFA
ncbi:MAG: chorismate mutase, partial [Myxococcales bacterium]|nr:chorismate mutase [Myxococcales bacterium]